MPLVFPSLGCWGATYEVKTPEGKVFRRRYQDNSVRKYVFPGSALAHIVVLSFKDMLQSEYNTIMAFVTARLLDQAQFYVYNPAETFTLDPTGAVTTGRHTCDEIVGDTSGAWSVDSVCRYNGSMTFYCID